MKRFLISAAMGALSMLAHSAAAETIAITGGKLVIGDGSAVIDGGTIIIRDDKIIAAGRSVTIPSGARRVDATGQWVTPGIFAGFSRIGLVEVDAVDGTNDTAAAASPFGPAIDVSVAVNPQISAIAVNRSAGVTRAVVAPATARSMFAGQGAIIDLGADHDAITKARAFQFVVFGEAGANKSGGSRAAAQVYFRNALAEAQAYQQSQIRTSSSVAPEDAVLKKADMAALVPVLNGRTKLVIHAESAADIRAVIALKNDYANLDIVIVGASEGWLVARELAAAKIPVIASALNNLPKSFEYLGETQSNIGRMKNAGVTVAIGMINDRDAHQLRYSTQYAGNLVSLNQLPFGAGLSWDDAFAAITSGPAQIMGLGDRLGSLTPGRQADIVVWDGDPLDVYAVPTAVYIDGKQQPLGNRQSRLRDRYRSPGEGSLPKAYDH